MVKRSLDDLLRAARLGETDAIAALCGTFYPKVLKYMRYRVDAASAEDLTGEVFLRALRHLGEQKGSFVAWLYRIAANVVIDHGRSKRARKETALDETNGYNTALAPDSTGASNRRMDIEAAISELTDDQRELVTLKFTQGLSNAEIAEVTGRTPEAVRALQFRALMALREILDRRVKGEGHDT